LSVGPPSGRIYSHFHADAIIGHILRARPLGLTSDPACPDEAFMVAELTPGALRGRRGVVVYGGEFR